jgi:hypothetical protein
LETFVFDESLKVIVQPDVAPVEPNENSTRPAVVAFALRVAACVVMVVVAVLPTTVTAVGPVPAPPLNAVMPPWHPVPAVVLTVQEATIAWL